VASQSGNDQLRKALSDMLNSSSPTLSPRMVRLIADLSEDWRRLDDRIAIVSAEIEALVEEDGACQRLMTVPGIGPIISSAVVAAIGDGAGFRQGRDFGAWLGLVPRQESTGDRTILGKISKRGNKYLRAGRPCHPRPSTKRGKARSMALDRAGVEAASPQHAGDRTGQ
jgi:transposase